MIYAVIPVKKLDGAKGRLAEVLAPAERRALVLAMLEDVLAALRGARELAGVGVISRDPRVLGRAAELGADALLDGASGLNGALVDAARFYAAAGATAVLALSADLPLLTPGDVAAMIALDDGRPGVVLAPSADGGTNALLARPPLAMPFLFGPGSLELHRSAARERDLPARLVKSPGLTFDVDRPDDLLRLAGHWATTAGPLVHELQITERMAWA